MRLARALVAATAVVFLLQGLGPARADAADCSAGTVLNVVAHEDDDILFINPDTQADITAGRCVRTVFLTAGDAGRASSYWQGREAGSRAAYAQMAGTSAAWTQGTTSVAGHTVRTSTLDGGGPDVRLVFLRLPDGNLSGSGFSMYGNESLQKLVQGTISSIHAVDGSATYSQAALVQTLTALMGAEAPSVVRTQDYFGNFGDGDHSDHHAAAYLARSAQLAYSSPHQFTGYEDYTISSRPANLTSAQTNAKLSTFLAYAAFDSTVCQTSLGCLSDGEYGPWFSRQYALTSSAGAPANDAFADAQALQGASGTVTGSNVGATKEPGEPAQAGNAGGASVWYSWTPAASGSATIDTAGSSFDTTLGVYTGTSVGALTLRDANDDVSGTTTSRVTLTVSAGTTYRISVDGYNAARGAITLHWALTAAAGAPANDAFAAAQALPAPSGTVTGSNVGATKEPGEPAQAGDAGGASVWYSWTPATSGSATIDTAGSSFDTTLGVYTGTSVGALTLRAANDDVASGTTTSRVTLTVSAGTTYRISVDGYGARQGAITLNWAGSTAATQPQITTQPTAQSVAAGATASFSAAASGAPAPTVQWQVSTNGGSSFANIAGATATTLTLTAVTSAQNQSQYRAVFTNSAGSATSAAATLTVTAAATQPQITTQPAAQSVAAGANASFSAAASGAPAPTVQWQVSTNGGSSFTNIAGATATTLTLTAVTSAQNQSQYRAVFTNSAGSATSAAATLTVTAAATQPQITTQPAAQSVAAGANASFSAAASGAPAPTVQWQVSTNGGSSFTNIAGATATTLTLTAVTSAQNQSQYRAVFTNSAGSATTTAATLTVTAAGAPANDAFAAAQLLQGASGTVTGSNVGATKEPGEPAQAGNAGGASVWYSWTPAASGSATIDTAGSSFDTTLGVYTGTSVGALTLRDANDDVSGTTTSRVTLTVSAGTTYRISVDGYNAARGAITLHWALTAAAGAPANDAFAAAQALPAPSGTVTGSNVGATKEPGEPAQAGDAGGASVWYSWTPATSGSATIDTAGSSFDTTLGVYTGTSVGALTLRAANDDVASGTTTSRVTLTVSAGTTYRISVDGYGARQGAITLNWVR